MSAYSVTVRGETFTVVLRRRIGDTLTLVIEDREYTVSVGSTEHRLLTEIAVQPLPKGRGDRASSLSKTAFQPEIRAPLPGVVSDLKVHEGDTVRAGETLVVIEAMKMENPIKAPADVRVTQVYVKKGQEIAHGASLLSVEPA
ncbi:MAG: hypothetical protein RL518_2121 [Pseudomonadota bacterium]|jgi:biotin carboxyl carrier protein